jgi:ATP-dependent RNA helicase DHX36
LASIVIEPQTKIQFPETSNALKLLGVGVREKKIAILNVKVYAVGMYADETKMNSNKKDAINDDEGLLLLNGNFEKEIVIKLNMSVNEKDFFKALEEALVPRISRIATDMATREDDEGNFMTTTAEYSEECEERALEEMEMIRDGLGKGGKLEKGAQISFTFLETGGEVAMVMKSSLSSGTEIAFKSYELAKALLDVYVGDDPISVEAKKAFEAGC